MKLSRFGRCAMLAAMPLLCATFIASTARAGTDSGCATLVGASANAGNSTANSTADSPSNSPAAPQGFHMRDGEPVDLVSGTKAIHGKLLMFRDGAAFRAYWQPENSAEKYVLANAGENSVRLVSTPPQGSPAENGEPGTAVAPQQVLSCPTL